MFKISRKKKIAISEGGEGKKKNQTSFPSFASQADSPTSAIAQPSALPAPFRSTASAVTPHYEQSVSLININIINTAILTFISVN